MSIGGLAHSRCSVKGCRHNVGNERMELWLESDGNSSFSYWKCWQPRYRDNLIV